MFLISESSQEKNGRPVGVMKSPRKFTGVVVATCGLPARGKTLTAYGISRRLNWNGESAKGMSKLIEFLTFTLKNKLIQTVSTVVE